MVVCKFFLQGNCRFGENCKFEHQLNDARPVQHTSILRQQNFTGNPNVGTIDINTLIRAVTNDMQVAEKGGQWLLSCYAPFKEKPNFPGFGDQSFEEVRWSYYQAQSAGTINQYCQQLQMALQDAANKIRALQNPTPDAVNTIKAIYNSPPNSSAPFGKSALNTFTTNQNSVFANPAANANVFGQPSTFGQNSPQQNSMAKSIFAAANQKLFGGAQSEQPSSIFSGGSPPGQSMFGNMSLNNSFGVQQQFNQVQPFNMQQQQQQQQQPFGVQQTSVPSFGGGQRQSNSPFYNSSSPFGGQQQPQQKPQQQSGNSPFTVQQPQVNNLPFNSGNQQPFISQQNSQSSPFGFNTQNTTTFFSNNAQPIQAAVNNTNSNSGSFFGSTNTTVVQAGLVNGYENAYSKPEDLSEADLKSYQSESFEFGKIPEKPPTIQMCF